MKEMTLKALIENIPQLTAFIDEELEVLDCSMKAQMQIDVAIDELFSNIARYAYPGSTGDATVRFDYDPNERSVSIMFMDHGIPFDPLQTTDPDISLPADQRQVGGMGIFLVKKTMDRIDYLRKNDMNILTITKKI